MLFRSKQKLSHVASPPLSHQKSVAAPNTTMADAAIAASHSSFCAKEVNKGVSTDSTPLSLSLSLSLQNYGDFSGLGDGKLS